MGMPMYIILINHTDHGIKDIGESPGHVEAFSRMVEEMGCAVHGNFSTMGRYDSTAHHGAG